MGDKTSSKLMCYCAFCKTPHRIYKKKGLGFWQFVVALTLTVSFMWSYWNSWNLQAIPLLLLSLFLSELILHFRWRLALICRQCGFDPLIYKKSPRLAASKVKSFLERRKKDPRFLLAPAIKFPKKIKSNPL